MPKITVINKNEKSEITANVGDNLLDILRKNGFYIEAACGGTGSCKKCQVKSLGVTMLSCQTTITADMIIEISSNIGSGLLKSVKKTYDVEIKNGYGIAIDLGTTTLAAYLINLETGEVLDSKSILNAQASYGADVITRIKKCSEGYLKDLFSTIRFQFNEIIRGFKKSHQILEIETIIVAANTTMLHILAGVDPTSLGVAPFTPVFLERLEIPGNDINIDAKKVILLPSISAYLGSDVVAGILACDMASATQNIILADIGTNGEIVLKTTNNMYGVSTAAGPAFEGAKIECGVGGIPGAISQVKLENKKLKIETIDNQPVIGICGSGLIDIISLLVSEGIIDETGSFDSDADSDLNVYLKNDRFYLGDNIYLSQKDIREFQLAKSAIASGIQVLVESANLKLEDIDKVYLAGGFGFYINQENAIHIGLLPKAMKHRIVSVGNTSGLGAKMALLNSNYLQECDKIAKLVYAIELSNNPKFTEYFIDNMLFE
jgi:uncharacterized 2Fe-2S/4Fe-4S cluster protein (DUF4445 family)